MSDAQTKQEHPKDVTYAAQVESGVWPQDSCQACQNIGFCCKRVWHHHLDCCLHCGNDERDELTWGYRGEVPRAPGG